MKKHLLLAVNTFLLGITFGYGYSLFSPPAKQQAAESEEQLHRYERAKDKLAAFSERDLQDYLRLQNLEAKYKKADELLGKMILILVADLGIKMSDEQVQFAKRSVVAAQSGGTKADNLADHQPIQHTALTGSGQLGGSLVTPMAAAPVPPQLSPLQWQKAETKLSGLRDAQDMEAFLKETRISNFGQHLSQSQLLRKPEPKITGCFEGEAPLQDGSGKVWHIKTETEFTDDHSTGPQKLNGKSTIEIYEGGKPINRSGNNGTLKNFKQFPGSSAALLIQISDILFMQAYPLTDRDMLIGNLYRLSDAEEFTFIASVQLHRTSCP